MVELILLAACGGALVTWGVVIRTRGNDRDAYMRMVDRAGFDVSRSEDAFLAHRDQSKFNGNAAIGFGAFFVLGALYNIL